MKVVSNVLLEVYDNDISENGKFIVPDNVTRIGDSTFYGCKSLEEVVIPNSVTEIGNYAFSGCKSLKEVVIPNGVTEIGDSAFWGCKSLEEVTIPNSVTEIGDYAFWGCESLKKVVIPESVTIIGYTVFGRCKSLEGVVIPNSVTTIKNNAFCECESLKEIVIPNGVTEIGNSVFNSCESLTIIYWSDKAYSVRCIDRYCMYILTTKNWDGYTISKCTYFPDSSNEIVYVVEKDGFSVHGSSVRKAVTDWQFKCMEHVDVSEHIARIAQQGYMDANDYRLLTGACQQGTDHFLQEHNLTWDDTMPVEEVLKITEGFYGFEKFQEAVKEILSYNT